MCDFENTFDNELKLSNFCHFFVLFRCRLSFGWYRAEVIGALTSVLMIWVVTAILFYLAVIRTIERNFELDGKVMLITSGLGILVNIM